MPDFGAYLSPNGIAQAERSRSGARRAAYGPRYVRKECAERRLPHVKRDKRVLVRWQDWLDHLESKIELAAPSPAAEAGADDSIERSVADAIRRREALAS